MPRYIISFSGQFAVQPIKVVRALRGRLVEPEPAEPQPTAAPSVTEPTALEPNEQLLRQAGLLKPEETLSEGAS